MNFSEGLLYEILYVYVSNVVFFFFKFYIKEIGKVERLIFVLFFFLRGGGVVLIFFFLLCLWICNFFFFCRDGDKMVLIVEKKISELEMGLLYL